MEEIERPGERRIRFQKFPQEPLARIPQHQQVETVAHHEALPRRERPQEKRQKCRHRCGLVELHRMTQNAVAEIVTPWQRSRYAVGVVLHAGEETPPSPGDDAGRKSRDEDQPRRSAQAFCRLVELNCNDRAGKRADNAASDFGYTRQPQIKRAEEKSAGNRTGDECGGISHPALLQPRHRFGKQPAVDGISYGHRRYGRQDVENRVDDHARWTTGSAIHTNNRRAAKKASELAAVTGSIASLPASTKNSEISSAIPLTAVSQKWICASRDWPRSGNR